MKTLTEREDEKAHLANIKYRENQLKEDKEIKKFVAKVLKFLRLS